MTHTPRIGMQIGAGDPFWVQVREVIWQRARMLPVEMVEVDLDLYRALAPAEQVEALEDLVVQELDALIGNNLSVYLLGAIPQHGIPLVYIPETAVRHPLLTSHYGLGEAAHMLADLLVTRRPEGGTVLVVSGPTGENDYIGDRLDVFCAALLYHGRYTIHVAPSEWTYQEALAGANAYLHAHPALAVDAIYGLSDSLALAGRTACVAAGRLNPGALVLGVNGDPLALAAIAEGAMTATVETDVDDIGTQAVHLACRAARGEPLPPHFQGRQRLVTADTVGEVATRKLITLADLPTRLVGVNRSQEQQRVVQLETSLAIDRQIGLILDEQLLSLAITALIRDNYHFDAAQFLIWTPSTGTLVEVSAARRSAAEASIHPDPEGPLAYALAHDRIIFIPDGRASHRFPPNLAWPEMRAQVVVPVHLGGQIVGLLDLHNRRAAHRTREELDGLQVLADQLGIAMRNAELYGQALAARELAEKADRLKTGLLANVSHELRTPLNVILGYSREALMALAGDPGAPPADLGADLTQIYRSGEHLLRLINDLLDLSRAEIDELDLLPERLDTRAFLEDLFRTSADHFGRSGAVAWCLAVPDTLPPVEADPVRLRQVLLNLLHNAHKFTATGCITLGAACAGAELHLWVADTGVGIPQELQAQIFEPFISVDPGAHRHEGIGLGLSIARRLIALHGGRLTVESRLGQGSTFHVYLPVPSPPPVPGPAEPDEQSSLLLIADEDPPAPDIVELAARRGLELRRLRPGEDVSRLAATARPALLAWDLAATETDGWALMQQMRRAPELRRLPLILYRHSPDVAGPDPAPAPTGVLLKPVGDRDLMEAIAGLGPRAAAGTILVVEDDPQTRALHRRVIADHLPGYRIVDVEGGRAALAFLAQETPSLVVLDLMMPDVDGFAVLAAVRADPRTAAVPVLVLSGRTLAPGDIERLAEDRVVFQTKDLLSEGELAESLRRTLAREVLLPPPTSALVKAAIAFIQQHYADPITRQEIAGALAVSKDYLGRIFHQELGISPGEYLIRYRVLRAKDLLYTTRYTVAEVATRVGFDNAAYFSHIFHREVGCSPRAFRQQR